MALDPRIALGVQPIQMHDPMDQYSKLASLQQAQNQNALAQYQLGAAQRADEQAANRLRLFQEAGGNPEKVANAFLQSGDWKGYTELTKSQSEKRASDLKFNSDLAQRAASIYSTVHDEPSWQSARQKLAALGGDASTLPERYDPAFVQSEIQQAFSVKDLAERVLTPQNFGGTARVISTPKFALPGITPTAAVVQGSEGKVTMTEAERAADARAAQRLSFDQAKWKWEKANPDMELKEGPDGQMIAVNKRTGVAQPVTMGGTAVVGSGKPLTESQSKAAKFSILMDNAFQASDKLEKSVGVGGKLLAGSSFTNFMAPEAAQQYEQAKRNWVAANLRQESGAVIGADEMAAELKRYFPVAGDGPKQVEQKRQARLDAMAGMEAMAGEGGVKAVQKSRQALEGRYPSNSGASTQQPASKPPAGIDAALWNVMTPQERALWQK